MIEAVHIIKDMVAKAPLYKGWSVEDVAEETHRRTQDSPANVVVVNVSHLGRLMELVPHKINRIGGTPITEVFRQTIPGAAFLGILENRYWVFISEDVPPDRVLVFNALRIAQGHSPTPNEQCFFCSILCDQEGPVF